jgi:predicted nucleic acid-binding protein
VSLYLDSSALVKLVQEEHGSNALRSYLRSHSDRLVSSALARVEVVRAVRDGGPDMVPLARRQFRRLFLVPLHRPLLDDASELGSGLLGSLDAIHLATARRLGAELRAVVTYDVRMQAEATALGMPTAAPS